MAETGLTRALGQFVSTLHFESLSAGAVATVKRGLIDCVGVLFLGRDEPVVDIVLESIVTSRAGEARVLGDRGAASAPDAAWVNTVAAHAFDYDDTGIDGHPSVVIAPAVLAEGERLGASGKEIIAAYVAGYEVWAELSARDTDKHHGKGWHPTAIFGTLAAAAASARLRQLDADRATAALGAAASMSAGLVANFGSMTKPLQVGLAVRNGMLAARLAASGLTAATDALERRNGFLNAVSPAGRARLDGPVSAGAPWQIERQGLNMKRYPMCYALHRAIDAVLSLSAGNAIAVAQVARIDVRLGRLQAGMLRTDLPRTALDAKFSAPFAMAAGVIAGRLGLAQVTDAFVLREDVQSLMTRVRIQVDESIDPDEPLFSMADSVTIVLADGRRVDSAPVARALGHAHNPVGLAELTAKFDDCVGDRIARSSRTRLLDRLARLDELAAFNWD